MEPFTSITFPAMAGGAGRKNACFRKKPANPSTPTTSTLKTAVRMRCCRWRAAFRSTRADLVIQFAPVGRLLFVCDDHRVVLVPRIIAGLVNDSCERLSGDFAAVVVDLCQAQV